MGAFHQKSIWWDAPLFLFLALARSTQHREAGRRSADANLMFEGIGSNSQQAERSELSGHRHCLPICEKFSCRSLLTGDPMHLKKR